MVVVLVLFFVVGGIVEIGRSSGPFHRSVTGSFASLGSSVVEQSNASASELRALRARLSGSTIDRAQLTVALGALVDDTRSQLDAVEGAAPPSPPGPGPASLTAALGLRARAARSLQGALDALLQMPAQPAATSAAPGGVATTAPAAISSEQAQADLVGVGSALGRSDVEYAAARRQLGALPGRVRLPASRWVRDPASWDPPAIGSLVTQVASAPVLLVVHQLALAAVRVDPGALPGPTPGAAASLPPTRHVTVTAVARNDGNVAEPGAVLTASLQQAGHTSSQSVRSTVSLGAGASTAVVLRRLSVRPGSSYVLTVSLVPPGSGAGAPPPLTAALVIGQAPPPTTTTTAPSTTTTTTTAPTTTTTAPRPSTTTGRSATTAR